MSISVVISTYNGENFIEEQLESIYVQTVQPDEVVIRDDGSNDKTVKICKNFIKRNNCKNWKLVENQVNLGWAENFMEGFRQSESDIIFPCDQDDIWMVNKIESMSRIIEANKNIDLLIAGYIKQIEHDGDKQKETKMFTKQLRKLPFNEKIIFVDYPGCVYCFRKSFFETIVPYSFNGYPHDALLLRMGKLLGTAYYYDIPIIYWRRHDNNATGKPVRQNQEMQKRIKYYIDCLIQMENYCLNHEGFEIQKSLIEENIIFYKTRLNAFQKRKIFGKNSLISCIKYLKFYPQPKSIIGDFIRLIH